jgi:hypothetical protein
MPKYAQYNPAAPAPSPVLGWYDTDGLTYSNLPVSTDLLSVTDDQWAARLANPSGWAVGAGALVAYAPPAPAVTLSSEAAAMIAGGIQIASTSTPALNGTYSVNATTYQSIMGIVAAISAGLGLPGGGSTFNWLDTSNNVHQFSAGNFTNFAKAVMTYLYELNIIVGSNAGTLPTFPVTIA